MPGLGKSRSAPLEKPLALPALFAKIALAY
jgi:hypothetical protein